MPTVPRYQRQVQEAPLPSARLTTPAPQTAQILGKAFDQLAEVAVKVRDQERTLKLSSMTTEATRQIEEFSLGLQQDSDYGTQYQRYGQLLETLEEQAMEQAGQDRVLFGQWKRQMSGVTLKKGFDIQSNAVRGQVQQARAGIADELRALSSIAGQGDLLQDDIIRSRGILLLGDAESNRIFTPEEAQRLRTSFEDDLAGAQVRYDIFTNPEAAEQKLLAGDYPAVSAERRIQWLERAVSASDARRRRQQAEEDLARRQEERERKRLADEAQKEGDKLLADNQLTPAWIDDNRDRLDPDDYRYFYRALTSDEGPTDPVVYTDLRTRAVTEDVRGEARRALQAGRIRHADYDRLSGIVEQSLVEQSLPNFYKRGEAYVRQALRTSDVNYDPAAEQRLAEALDDWYEWSRANMQAPPEQARAAYRSLVNDYQLIDLRNNPLIERRPRYLVGSRGAPDLAATAAATVEARARGELTDEEYVEQARIISAWQDMVRAREETQ